MDTNLLEKEKLREDINFLNVIDRLTYDPDVLKIHECLLVSYRRLLINLEFDIKTCKDLQVPFYFTGESLGAFSTLGNNLFHLQESKFDDIEFPTCVWNSFHWKVKQLKTKAIEYAKKYKKSFMRRC